MALHVKTVTVVHGEGEPFDAQLRKTIQGITTHQRHKIFYVDDSQDMTHTICPYPL